MVKNPSEQPLEFVFLILLIFPVAEPLMIRREGF